MSVTPEGNWGVMYRPRTIEDMVGNNGAKDEALSLVEDARSNKAYFPATVGITGLTGTGKTTLARAIAEAINGVGSHDIIEFDCGENGSIDSIRNLAEESRYQAVDRFRLYIMDEAHLLSKQASSVLLKLFEEPPARTRFIWCTDQPNKMLPTIIGRSFIIALQPPTTDELVGYLMGVLDKEEVTFGSKELRLSMLRALCARCGNMPRQTVNSLQKIVARVSSRLKKGGGEVTKDELKDVVASIFEEDAAESPYSYAMDILANLYGNDKGEALFCVHSYNGDPDGLLNMMVAINAAYCRISAGVEETNRFATVLTKKQRAVAKRVSKEKPANAANPLAGKRTISPYLIQSKLVDALVETRVSVVPASTIIPARLSAIIGG